MNTVPILAIEPMSIIALIGTVLSIVFWLIKRRASKVDDPKYQIQKAKEDADKAIAKGAGGVTDVNRQLDDLLRRVQPVPPKSGGDSSGQGSHVP